MLVTIEAFARKIRRAFSPAEWMGRLLNLPKIKIGESDPKPGLVMIQIDGLGFTQAERAVHEGHMPFIARLVKKEDYRLLRHYSGLPSNTPAVQGQLFYGVKACVPTFSFKDSRSGKIFNMFNPESAAAVEDRIKDKGEPLLKEGSAYGNIFTGGAKEAHFCASSIGWGGLLKAASPTGVPLTILLNLRIFVRALFLMILEFILAISDFVRGILLGKNFMTELGFIPLRVAICVLLRDAIAAGAKIDIARGMPVIHVNLAGYDEQSHHRGPSSFFARWSLKGIDQTISFIWKAAQRSQRRRYHFFVYSDHGQEETISYQEEYGRSVEDAVDHALEEQIASGKWRTEFSRSVPHWRAHLLRNKPLKILETMVTQNKNSSLRAVVTAMGPVGHVYLPEKLTLEEKEKIALQLVTQAKMPIVMASHGAGQAVAWTTEGKFLLPKDTDKVIDAQHPFFKEVARDLVELCHHPDSGELIIFGWRKGRKSLTFYGEQGSHAGPGPEETSGFVLLPQDEWTSKKKSLYTQDLREAAFRAQERGPKNTDALSERMAAVNGARALRIMTYNVHKCMGRDGKISPQRIAWIIAKHNPDIIALQELGLNEQAYQAQIIAQKLEISFHFHPSLSVKKGQLGNAILSKFPMKLVRNGSLPRLPHAPYLEPRGALWVEIDVHGQKVQVLNTHLSLSSRERLLQMKTLLGPDWLGNSACRGPVIFCGDFNALARSKIFKGTGPMLKNTHFELSGHRPLKTLPSFYPMRLVDHVFVGPGIQTTKIKVPNTQLERMSSDHLPLIVELQLTGKV